MKIVWLAPYQLSLLRPEVKFRRDDFSERAAPWIENLSNELGGRENIELTLITKSAQVSKNTKITKNGINFIILKYNFPFTGKGFPKYLPFDKILWYFPLPNRIKNIIRNIDPDIIHAHGTETLYSYAAIKSGKPHITSIQGLISVYNQIKKYPDKIQEKIEKWTISKSKYLGCRTIWDEAEVKKINPNVNIRYLPEAMNPLFFNNTWNSNASYSLTFVGSFDKRKGLFELVNAAKSIINSFPNFTLNIIADLSHENFPIIKSLCEEYGILSNFYFLGYRPHSEMVNILSNSLFYILPTYMDNSPNSLCEAMVMGMPCIASNVGGIPSLIEDGKNGLLVQKGNIKDLSEKMMLLITNKKLRENIGAQAAKDAYQRHYPSMVANQTISVYKEIIEAYAK